MLHSSRFLSERASIEKAARLVSLWHLTRLATSKNCGMSSITLSDLPQTERFSRLNLMFTVAAVVTNVAALPVGTILDRYGPRVASIIGSFFVAVGSAFFIFAPEVPFDAYIPGYSFLALGGPFVYISSFQLSNCFPRHSGLILALLTGAFDTSSAIFLAYRLIYQASEGTFSPQKFFSVYLVVPAFLVLVQIFVMPAASYKTAGEIIKEVEDPSRDVLPEGSSMDHQAREEYVQEQRRRRRDSVLSEITPLLGGKKGQDKARRDEERKQRISGVWGALHGRSALHQIQSPWFILITAFVMFQMLRINYFVATIRPQYEYLLQSQQLAKQVNDFFDVALPVGGVLSIPFIGLILDNLSTAVTLSVLVATATTIGILGCLPYLPAAYLNIILFVIYRPFYYTAVSDYAAKVFGFYTFGKVYGLIICISGLFNLSQSALDALRFKAFGNDPVPVNAVMLGLVLAEGVLLVVYVYRKSLKISRDLLEEEAEDADETTIPDVTNGLATPPRRRQSDS